MLFFKYLNKIKYVSCCVFLALIFYTNLFASPIFLISCRPAENLSPLGPHTAYIYKLDEEKGLNEVWTLGKEKIIHSVRIYEDGDAIIFGVGKPYLTGLHILKISDINKEQIIDFDNAKSRGDYRYYDRPNDIDYIKYYSKKMNNKNSNKSDIIYNIHFDKNEIDKSFMTESGNVSLAGVGSEKYGGDEDITKCSISKDGILKTGIDDLKLEIEPVPDSIIKFNKSNIWTMYSSGPDFIILNSKSLEPGILKRELLIYNFNNKEWLSLLINGPRTSLRLINDWLVGVITKYEDETDKMKYTGTTSMLSEDIVVINPTTKTMFEEHLGKDCEVLWIDDNNTVYYKTWHSLYKAKIENDHFVDKQLILTNPIVYTIHWAFMSNN